MSARAWLAVVALLVAMASSARADDRTDAEALFRVGEKAFDATQYAVAADAFEQAYAKLPLPAIAFSTAQAHRLQFFVDNQPRHLERAVELYKHYIDDQKTGGRVQDAVANLATIEPLLRELVKAGASTAAGPASKATQLVVTADVPAARATIDGDSGPVPFVHAVTPGEHTVTITADGYATQTRKALAVEGIMVPVEVQLAAKPAVVFVSGPSGAHVAIDTRPAGDAPLANVELAAGRHVIAISERGHVPFVREVDLGRGATLKLAPELRPTRQRRAVPWVTIGASGLAVAAGVAAVLAHSAQSDAEAQQAKLTAGGADPQLVAKYNADLATRDARVHDTAWLGAAAGAALVTAGLLYLLDDPTPEAPPALAPLVGPRSAGVAYGGRF